MLAAFARVCFVSGATQADGLLWVKAGMVNTSTLVN
jgi:hypothetical protein